MLVPVMDETLRGVSRLMESSEEDAECPHAFRDQASLNQAFIT
jgi:hypothetical protein